MRIERVVWQSIVALLLVGYAAVSMAQPGTDCLIKGIIGNNGQKMYLVPGHYLYDKVTPDLNKGERWFCEAAGAERAGFVFVPDPTNRNLRPQEATPTPPPTATPEPQPTDMPESAGADTTSTDVSQTAADTSALAEPEPTEPPTPEPPTATPAPVETEKPEPVSDAPSPELFPQPVLTGTPLNQLSPILQQLPPEVLAQLQQLFQQLPPEARTFIVLILAWIPVIIGIIGFIWLMIIVVRWKLFVKAGEPGWAAIIPIYSEVLMLKIAGLAWWWILIGIVPVVQLAFAIVWIFIRPFKTAENFGKGFLYGLGLFLFPFSPLFWLLLAFSDAEYVGP